jgi:uncharacterized phage protein gp47/JayE
MPQPTIPQYEQLLSEALSMLVARTGLSDVSDTSIAKHLLAIFCRQMAEQGYQMLLLKDLFSIDRATGEDLDERAKDIQPGTLPRLTASKATGEVVFSRTGTVGSTTIPSGTKVKTASGVMFQTTVSATIAPTSPELVPGHGVGRDISATVVAVEAGADGNVAAGTIIKFDQKPAGVTEVTNIDPTLYGADRESDDAFRKRLKAWVASLARSTILSLETAVLGAVDPVTGAEIKFATAFEDPINRGYVTLYIDDGQGTAEQYATATGEDMTGGGAIGGETQLYLDNKPVYLTPACILTSSTRGVLAPGTDYALNEATGQVVFDPALTAGEIVLATYTYATGLVALAQKIVDGDPADRTTYPGYRAAGVIVRCQVPQVLLQNVGVALFIAEGYDGDTVRSQVSEAIKTYINGLAISGDVIFYELVERVMAVQGVMNASFSAPTSDVTILDNQLARTTSANIQVI